MISSEYESTHLFDSILRLVNFRARDVKWLNDSFAVTHGLDKSK